MIKVGQVWRGNSGEIFRVLAIVEQQDNTWVHYRKESISEPTEYSCYLESFLTRFSLCSNENC